MLSTKSRTNCICSHALEQKGKALQNPLPRGVWVKSMLFKHIVKNEDTETGWEEKVKRMHSKSNVEVTEWTKQQALKVIQPKNKNKYRRKLLHCSPHCVISTKALRAAFLFKMATDSWSKHKVMRTGRGQEGGSGRGWTEDAPDQQGFNATGKHRQHKPQGQAALFSTLP